LLVENGFLQIRISSLIVVVRRENVHLRCERGGKKESRDKALGVWNSR
jgi:hypothetical protein